MKAYLPIAIAVALVLAALVVGLVTSPRLQSPQTRLFNAIDERIEEAQGLLYAYQPDGERLLTATAATQPVELLPEDRWSEHLDAAAFQERIERQARDLRAITQRLEQLGIEPGPRPGGAAPSFERLEQDLRQNQDSIERALSIVRSAIAMTAEAGDVVVRGSSHPAATRLEAILITTQADLLRRRAAVYEAQADTYRTQVSAIASAWRLLDAQLQALAPDLSAAVAQPTRPRPTSVPAVAAKPKAHKPGLLTRLLGRVTGSKPGGQEPPPVSMPGVPGEPGAMSTASGSGLAEADSATPAPRLDQRLTDLDQQRQQTLQQLEQAKADAAKIEAELAGLMRELAQVQAVADEAHQRMLNLDQAESDPTDPSAPERFETDYRAASQIYRQASRKKAELIGSAVPNTASQPAADSAADLPAGGIIAAVNSRLSAARRRTQDLQNVLSTIDAQIAQLRQRRQDLAQRQQGLRAAQAQLEAQAAQAARAAIAAARSAGQFERQALDLLDNDGRRAAQNARGAEENRLRQAQAAKREITGQTTNPRLDLIAQGQFIVGHAQTLEADVEFMRAQVLAQQVRDLERHRDMLVQIESMGIPHLDAPQTAASDQAPTPTASADQSQAGPSAEQQAAADYLLSSQAATTKIGELRAAAVQAAKAALEIYAAAEGQLNRLWVIRATRAAVNYLLANLNPGPQGEPYRAEAIRMFQQAVQPVGDLPEARPYRRILEGLTQTAP